MDIIAKISEELGIKRHQTEAAVKLIDEGNTIPFIARYRKEATGALNDEVLRNLSERLTYLRGLEERKETVLASIEEQGKLTDELKAQILSAAGGFIPPVQAEAQNARHDRQGKGTGTACRCDYTADDKNAAHRRGGKIRGCRKGSYNRRGGDCGSVGYYCGVHL